MAVIEIKNLTKEFRKNKKESGFKGAIKHIIKPDKTTFKAVDNISFSIEKGEIVGFIGPNGAGKSTTIKMSTGILQPTDGKVSINNLDPKINRKKVVQDIGVVFGQRSQLYWDLRLGESFELLKRIYQIDDKTYKENLSKLNEVLNLDEIVDTSVRQLSLGQRMKGDLAAAMLHSPKILFLDEPTIGLDVEVKYLVRDFIKEINKTYGTTIILTTHDLADIQKLCSRVIIINKGTIVRDSTLDNLFSEYTSTNDLDQIIIDIYQKSNQKHN